ncbi:glycosyl hydrolase family 28-related protein, partial [uncultured Eubacterium sp.]
MKTSFYTGKIEDESAIYFDADHFNISSDGIVDVSDELQKAVNMVVEEYGYGIVFVPEGKYLLSKTIYIPKAVRIIGYGEKRPEFILKDNALNFNISKEDDKGHFRYLFWFVDRVVTEGTNVNANDANPGTFYSAMSNVNINLGRENDYAVAFRTHYAQHAFLAHITINVNSGMAGIYDVGNEMEDIEIVGGNYGIITTKCSPGWPFVMVDTKFENQKKAAIFTREAGLTIVRTDVKNVPQFVEVQDGFFEKLYIEDSIFKNVDKLLNIALENNSLTSIYVKNCYLEKCNVIVSYKDTENTIDNKYDCAHINEYIHGITASDEYPEKQIKDILYIGEKQIDYNVLYTDLKTLPEVKQWINVKKNGLIGDGVTDDTKVLKELIEKYTYLYFPQGEYLLTDTIKLKDDTVIIGLNPVSTKFILKDNAERFTGYGKGIAFIESGKSNILFGIGIETGGKNPRAIGLKWNGDIDSYINDVKMFGGHGNLVKGTGAFEMPYNSTRTADSNPERMWDYQYPSIVVNGGGVIKDVWSASPYVTAGITIENTDTPGKIYCMSLEHHCRHELLMNNVKNWTIYGIQTEEEVAEGEFARPIELHNCEDITFAMTYHFRTIFVNKPYD